MISITALIKERVAWLKDVKPLLRTLDGKIEAAEREVVRFLNRKKALLEEDDLKGLQKKVTEISKALVAVQSYLKKGFKR